MTRIVLAGGGHANALALLQLGEVPGLTLVSDTAYTPYSGMLPGYIGGLYEQAQCFIDLERAAARVGADFICARAVAISDNELILDNRQRLPFDVLSINTGALPLALSDLGDQACAVKPISDFIHWLKQQDEADLGTLAVVGGGAGGCETILSLAHRWRDKKPRPALSLVTPRLLPDSTDAMRRYIQRRLAANGIELVEASVSGYDGERLLLANGGQREAARVIYSTAATSAAWFHNTGLPLDERGFLRVNDYLQSPAAVNIFISGDAAAHTTPLAKAGVMAVRQGKLLPHNLLVTAGLRDAPLKRFEHNTNALYILGAGNGREAVASRNGLTVSGRWVWHWKQYLDFKFMNKFAH